MGHSSSPSPEICMPLNVQTENLAHLGGMTWVWMQLPMVRYNDFLPRNLYPPPRKEGGWDVICVQNNTCIKRQETEQCP